MAEDSNSAASSTNRDTSAGEYAFNFHLWAYDLAIPNRSQSQIIRYNKISKLATSSDRVRAVQDAINSPRRPSLMPAAEKLHVDIDNEAINSAVVVGIRPCHSPVNDGDQHYGDSDIAKPVQKGASIRTLKEITTLQHDPHALRVICPRFRTYVTFYALVEQHEDTKLCDGILVDDREVFFYPEFCQDDLTSHHARDDAWPEQVRKLMGKIGSKSKKRKRAELAADQESEDGRSASAADNSVSVKEASLPSNGPPAPGNESLAVRELCRTEAISLTSLASLVDNGLSSIVDNVTSILREKAARLEAEEIALCEDEAEFLNSLASLVDERLDSVRRHVPSVLKERAAWLKDQESEVDVEDG